MVINYWLVSRYDYRTRYSIGNINGFVGAWLGLFKIGSFYFY
ncbi:hypothetical protein [Peribacillus sp. TH16]|nr:hypothetical protein [Peribacillus sp. TH16]